MRRRGEMESPSVSMSSFIVTFCICVTRLLKIPFSLTFLKVEFPFFNVAITFFNVTIPFFKIAIHVN